MSKMTILLWRFENRKTVCQGYTNLMVALLLAIGIPAKGLSCFSLEFQQMEDGN